MAYQASTSVKEPVEGQSRRETPAPWDRSTPSHLCRLKHCGCRPHRPLQPSLRCAVWEDNSRCCFAVGQWVCAETEPEPSSRTGRRCGGEQRQTWQQNKTDFITGTETFCTRNSLSFYPHARTVTPRYLPPSITDSVTSHCITLILIGQTIKLPGKSQNQENRGLFAHQPPIGLQYTTICSTSNTKTEHKCAEMEPELHNLLVRVLTPCSPASSHLARLRLHLHNGRRRPARQERTVRLSRLVSFHALLLSPQCHTTGPGYGPRTAR